MSFNFSDIIDYLPDGTFVIDHNGVVMAWNLTIAQMTGVEAKDIVGKGDFEYAIPFYGKRRPILIDLVGGQHGHLRRHYNVKVVAENTLYAEAFVASAYGGKGAYLSGMAAPLYTRDDVYVGAVESIRDITAHIQVEETLRKRTIMLEETNAAIKVLLRETAAAKEELEERVLANVRDLIFPFISDLEATLTEAPQQLLLQTIRANLNQITSSFSKQLSSKYLGLTPREIQIADFIRQGMTNKEIACRLKLTVSAIDFHRRNLRQKLGIKGAKINLRSFLLNT